MKGKATVINQLATSILLYTGSVFTLPDWAYKIIEAKTWEFFWGGKSCPVKKTTCRRPLNQGGYNMPDFKNRITSLRIKYIALLLSDAPSKWRPLAFYYLNKYCRIPYGKTIFASLTSNTKLMNIPPFYRALVTAWQAIGGQRKFDPRVACHSTIMNELLFNNKHILNHATGKPIFLPSWIDLGVVRVRDITYEVVPGFLSAPAMQEMLDNTVNLKTCERQVNLIQSALPREWRDAINKGPDFEDKKEPDVYGVPKGTKFIPVEKLTSQKAYQILQNNNTQTDTQPTVWRNCYLPDFWKGLHNRPLDRKIADIDWKIVNSGLHTAVKLKKWKLINTDTCKSCKSQKKQQNTFSMTANTPQFCGITSNASHSNSHQVSI